MEKAEYEARMRDLHRRATLRRMEIQNARVTRAHMREEHKGVRPDTKVATIREVQEHERALYLITQEIEQLERQGEVKEKGRFQRIRSLFRFPRHPFIVLRRILMPRHAR